MQQKKIGNAAINCGGCSSKIGNAAIYCRGCSSNKMVMQQKIVGDAAIEKW